MTNYRGANPPKGVAHLHGEIGKSIIDRPFYWVTSKELEYKMERIKKYVKILILQNDIRLMVIDGALIIETEIDTILDYIMPNYRQLNRNKDLSFYLKVELLSSFGLIPNKILAPIDLVRKLRNKIAHNLEVDTTQAFKSFEDELKKTFRSFFPYDLEDQDNLKTFTDVLTTTITGLVIYGSSVNRLFKYLREADIPELLHNIDMGGIEGT